MAQSWKSRKHTTPISYLRAVALTYPNGPLTARDEPRLVMDGSWSQSFTDRSGETIYLIAWEHPDRGWEWAAE